MIIKTYKGIEIYYHRSFYGHSIYLDLEFSWMAETYGKFICLSGADIRDFKAFGFSSTKAMLRYYIKEALREICKYIDSEVKLKQKNLTK